MISSTMYFLLMNHYNIYDTLSGIPAFQPDINRSYKINPFIILIQNT